MKYPIYTLIYFHHSIMIVFDYKILQLTSQNNHNYIENIEIVHVIWRLCATFHHSDLYQVCAHMVGERLPFVWLVCRKWYETRFFCLHHNYLLSGVYFSKFIWWRFLFTHLKYFVSFDGIPPWASQNAMMWYMWNLIEGVVSSYF